MAQSFSYSGNPLASALDQVRFLVGDTDDSEPLLYDEEIAFLLVTWAGKGSAWYTASMAAQAIAAKLAREVTTSSDSQTVAADSLQQKYQALADQLMNAYKAQLAGGNVDVGGIDAFKVLDPTVAPPAFGTGMHDSFEAGPQDYGDAGDVEFDQLTQSWYLGRW